MLTKHIQNRIGIKSFDWLDKIENYSDDLVGQVITNKNGVIPNPCVSLCSGTIEVNVVESDGDPMSGSYVHLNGALNDTTNSDGKLDIDFSSVGCGLNQNVSIFCNNNQSRFCAEKTAKMDLSGDNDSLIFDCNICKDEKDLSISLGDIKLASTGDNNYDVKVNVHSENVNQNNVNVTVRAQSKTTGLIARQEDDLISFSGSGNVTATINLDMTDIDYLHVYVDASNPPKVNEPKTNNYVLRPFIREPVRAYLEVDTGIPRSDEAISGYLSSFIDEQGSPSNQYLNIIIGTKGNTFKSIINPYTKNNLKTRYYYDTLGKRLLYNGDYLSLPYNGIVGGFWRLLDGRYYVVAYGNDVDGDIAAVKKLVSAKDIFLTTSSVISNERTVVIDDFDVTGLSVMDLFHNQENKQFYGNGYRGTENFKDVVTKILSDNNFEIAIKTVKTTNDNTTLRLKNINTDYSSNFKDAIVNNSKPVVFAGGLFSDLFRWEDFAKKLASDSENARDSWTIEITGGPATDANCLPSGTYNCPNYNYNDLVDYYWPALIAGVEQYSGQNELDYVGHSNGCRVALDSLKNYSVTGKNNAGYYFDSVTGQYILTDLASNPVDTFVGLGCPGALNGSSHVVNQLIVNGGNVLAKYIEKNISHISGRKFAMDLDLDFDLFWPSGKISLNLGTYYYNISKASDDPQSGNGLFIDKFYLIAGEDSISEFGQHNEDDGIVPLQDPIAINKTVSYNTGNLLIVTNPHHRLPDVDSIQNYIKKILKG